MFFPLADDDRYLVRPAYVTWSLLAINIFVFFVQASSDAFTYGYAAVPAEITSGDDLVGIAYVPTYGGTAQIPHAPGPRPIQLTLLSAMFMHGGFMHLAGNMLFLWIFGDNVEHRFGHRRFLLFYLGSGLAASFAQIATDPNSVIPTLGASGAIAGVLGAYLVLFPHNRVTAFVFIYVVSIPAYVVIAVWAVTQFVNGFGQLVASDEVGGVAYAAHIGGFIVGGAIALACRFQYKSEPDSILMRAYRRDPRDRQVW